LREVRDEFERAYLLGLLERCKWQVVEAARTAGIDRVTLFRMMRRHPIERSG
jgi:transcriptional regulator of acetoin/glycerol metabolism